MKYFNKTFNWWPCYLPQHSTTPGEDRELFYVLFVCSVCYLDWKSFIIELLNLILDIKHSNIVYVFYCSQLSIR